MVFGYIKRTELTYPWKLQPNTRILVLRNFREILSQPSVFFGIKMGP